MPFEKETIIQHTSIVHGFIEKTAVSKKIEGDAGHRIQHIRIYRSFPGDVEIPDEWLYGEQDTVEQYENEQ